MPVAITYCKGSPCNPKFIFVLVVGLKEECEKAGYNSKQSTCIRKHIIKFAESSFSDCGFGLETDAGVDQVSIIRVIDCPKALHLMNIYSLLVGFLAPRHHTCIGLDLEGSHRNLYKGGGC